MPAFATSALENYIDQTINGQNSITNQTEKSTAKELLDMDHYDRHSALTNMLDTIKAGADKKQTEDLFLLGYYYYSEAEDNSKDEDFHKAQDYFKQAEKQGSADALYLLGELYYYGEGVEQDYLKAAEYYEKAADLKQKNALFSLGSLYMSGFGVDENSEKAVEYYKRAAKLGDNPSMNSLGYFYETGEIVSLDIDLTEAANWYQQACDNGNSNGCDAVKRLKVHTMTFDTVLSEIDKTNESDASTSRDVPSVSTFTEADDYDRDNMLSEFLPEIIHQAKSNDKDAIYLLGLYHEVKGDDNYDEYAYGQAKILYEKAIELGSSDATYSLAELYYYGNGVEQDYQKSLELYADPKLASHAEAVFSQAVQYDSGEGVEQDYEISFNLFNKASELGHIPSTFNVGYMYEYGEFVDADLEEAKKWYQKACDNHYSDGCYAVNLVDEKIAGDNTPKDGQLESLFNEIMGNEAIETTALELTTESILNADQDRALEFLKSKTDILLENVKNDNDIESLFLTGYLFYLEALENSSQHTYSQSYALMEKAADQGFLEANYYLGMMSFHGEGVDQDYEKSRELFEKMIDETKNADALFYLATIYDEGLGIQQDQEKSFSLYKRAAALKHSDSTYNVGFMYHHGEFVEKDEVEAQKWYDKACDLGDLDGCELSSRLSRELNGEEMATEEIVAEEVFIDEIEEEPSKNEETPIKGSMEELFDNVLEIFGSR